jgi:hypothetical protein
MMIRTHALTHAILWTQSPEGKFFDNDRQFHFIPQLITDYRSPSLQPTGDHKPEPEFCIGGREKKSKIQDYKVQ